VEASGWNGHAAVGRVLRAARGADTGEGGLGQRRRKSHPERGYVKCRELPPRTNRSDP